MSYFKWVVIIIVTSALITTLAFGIKYLTSSKQIKPAVSSPAPGLSTIPPASKPASKPIDLESCDIKAEDNPLVEGKIEKFTDPNAPLEKQEVLVGRFYGILHTINLKPDKSEADIQLISPKGDQILPFVLKEEKGVIEDSKTLRPVEITKLKSGFTIQMSFNCFPKEKSGQRFNITKFAVTGK